MVKTAIIKDVEIRRLGLDPIADICHEGQVIADDGPLCTGEWVVVLLNFKEEYLDTDDAVHQTGDDTKPAVGTRLRPRERHDTKLGISYILRII